MLIEPTIVQRDEQPYLGRRESVTMTSFGDVADHLPGLFGWLDEHGAVPSGPPFFRYRVIDMAATLVVEAGIPVERAVRGDDRVFAGVLPAGRYASVSHVGHPDELMGVTGELLDWGRQQGLRWDMTPTPEGEEWGCRREVLMPSPAQEPDMHKWQTVLMFRLAD